MKNYKSNIIFHHFSFNVHLYFKTHFPLNSMKYNPCFSNVLTLIYSYFNNTQKCPHPVAWEHIRCIYRILWFDVSDNQLRILHNVKKKHIWKNIFHNLFDVLNESNQIFLDTLLVINLNFNKIQSSQWNSSEAFSTSSNSNKTKNF